MPAWLILILALVMVAAVFLTTRVGERVRSTLGIPAFTKAAASRRDRAFLLRVCGGDPREVERRLDSERRRFPALTEAEIHRRAIRSYMTSSRPPEAGA